MNRTGFWICTILLLCAGLYVLDRSGWGRVYTDGQKLVQPMSSTPARTEIWETPEPFHSSITNLPDHIEPVVSPGGEFLIYAEGRPGENVELMQAWRHGKTWGMPQPIASINTADDELGPSLADDGKTLFFYSNRPGGQGQFDIWQSTLSGDREWSPATNLGAAVNSPFEEYDPEIHPNGSRLFFASDRPEADDPAQSHPEWTATQRARAIQHDFNIYAVSLVSNGAVAEAVEMLNSPRDEGQVAFTDHGDFVYFSSNREGGHGGFDLYRSRILGGQFKSPDNLAAPVNSPRDEMDPALWLEGHGLIFSSNRDTEDLSRFALFESVSREVFSTWRLSGLVNFLRANKWMLLALILSLLALLWLLRLFMSEHRRRAIALIYRCMLASLALHLLILFLFSFYQLAQAVYNQSKNPMEVAINEAALARERMSTEIREQVHELPRVMRQDAPVQRTVNVPKLQGIDVPPPPTFDLPPAPPSDMVIHLEPKNAQPDLPMSEPQMRNVTLPRRNMVETGTMPLPVAEVEPEASPEVAQPDRPDVSNSRLVIQPAEAQPLRGKLTDLPAPDRLPAPLTPSTAPQPILPESGAEEPPADLPTLLTESTPQLEDAPEQQPEASPSDATRVPDLDVTKAQADTPGAPAAAKPTDVELDNPIITNVLSGVDQPTENARIDAQAPMRLDPARLPKALKTETAQKFELPEPTTEENLTNPAPRPIIEDLTRQDAVPDTALPPRSESTARTLELPESATTSAANTTIVPPEVPEAPIKQDIPQHLPQPIATRSSNLPLDEGTRETRAREVTLQPTTPKSASLVHQPVPRGPSPLEARPATSPPLPGLSDPTIVLPSRSDTLTLPQPDLPDFDLPVSLPPPALNNALVLEDQPMDKLVYRMRDPELRKNLIEDLGGDKSTEEAIERALKWFAANQEKDGRWDIGRHGGEDRHDVAATGMALLSFLGFGMHHKKDGPYREQVQRAVDWLSNKVKNDGDIRDGGDMYDQGIGSLALCEAYGLTRDPALRSKVEKLVDFIVKAQNQRDGGWRYSPREKGDTSVFGWQVMALKSAMLAGVDVPESTLEKAEYWLARNAAGKQGGWYGYQGRGHKPAMVAEGMFCRQLLGKKPVRVLMDESADYLTDRENKLPSERKPDFYLWYYGSLALYQHQGPQWEAWNNRMKTVLKFTQEKSGKKTGSWNPGGQHGNRMGRVVSTAFGALTLEVYYRYLPLYGVRIADED